MRSRSDRLLRRVNALEGWLEAKSGRPRWLPVRAAGYALLAGLLLASNVAAVLRWPFASLLGETPGESELAKADGKSGEPVAADAATLQRLIERERLVLVDFWAPWCGPCLMMKDALQAVARDFEGAAHVAEVNTTTHGDAAAAHDVKGLPTLLVFQDGEEVERHTGALSRRGLTALLEKHATAGARP